MTTVRLSDFEEPDRSQEVEVIEKIFGVIGFDNPEPCTGETVYVIGDIEFPIARALLCFLEYIEGKTND